MSDLRAQRDLRVNVLRADEVAVWHRILELARELDHPTALLRSIRFGCFAYVGADGRTGTFTPAMIAQVLELPPSLVASTVEKLIELGILTRDGDTLSIEAAADWFVPASEHPPLRN